MLQDLGLPPDDGGVTEGFATLREILSLAPFTKVVVVTGHGDQSNAVKAVGMGAYDFYQKPVDVDTLQLIVQRAFQIHALEAENRRLLEALGTSPLDGVIAASDSMLKVCRTIEKVAPTNATTLLLRRERHRQGSIGARNPRVEPACGQAVRCDQLRRDSRHAAGVGAVRFREGRVHGRREADAGQDRSR